jgi:hypothetical protein
MYGKSSYKVFPPIYVKCLRSRQANFFNIFWVLPISIDVSSEKEQLSKFQVQVFGHNMWLTRDLLAKEGEEENGRNYNTYMS